MNNPLPTEQEQARIESLTAAIIKLLLANADQARALVKALPALLKGRATACTKGCHTALDSALITAPEARDPELAARLDAVAGRVLKAS